MHTPSWSDKLSDDGLPGCGALLVRCCKRVAIIECPGVTYSATICSCPCALPSCHAAQAQHESVDFDQHDTTDREQPLQCVPYPSPSANVFSLLLGIGCQGLLPVAAQGSASCQSCKRRGSVQPPVRPAPRFRGAAFAHHLVHADNRVLAASGHADAA